MEPKSRPTASAGAVLADEGGRVLIVKPTYTDGWNLPGGGIEDGENERDACRREVREELGLDVEPRTLLVRATVSVSGRSGSHTFYIFDGGVLSPDQQQSITLQESELSGFRFVAPEDIAPEDIPPARRPLWEAALTARAEQRTVEIEIAS